MNGRRGDHLFFCKGGGKKKFIAEILNVFFSENWGIHSARGGNIFVALKNFKVKKAETLKNIKVRNNRIAAVVVAVVARQVLLQRLPRHLDPQAEGRWKDAVAVVVVAVLECSSRLEWLGMVRWRRRMHWRQQPEAKTPMVERQEQRKREERAVEEEWTC